ncbi:conserved hypothetical protein [Streptomyces himastatinicus ATCC 53653]|uniref:Thymidylate kinase-like domain-containing protein n=1 Tax=Streptomyces himastatinicus ATCC 53653 TaxID=457427 RepID=D9W785_9ACTN|nr:hypothetical protein [Streptomyces himastatinicus]EFL26696.1 conserved hypothetical protein [Streptomyces himastatinicus ATCC 53653]
MGQEITQDQLKSLEHRAQRICNRLARSETQRPIAVEFAGSPKSGKSSTIDTIVHFFKRMGFRVFAPTEGASKRTPEQLRKDRAAFNVWTVNYAISQLLSAYYDDSRSDLIILDRGCFDSVAWNELQRKKDVMGENEAKVIRDFALHPMWAGFISKLYLFTCEPEVSLERETAATLTTLEGRTMNRETLSELLREYRELRDSLNTYPLMVIDTTAPGTPQESGYKVAEDIVQIWEEKLSMA